jgi:hypothetical protein
MKRPFMYESRKQPLASRKVFSQRLKRNSLLALATIVVALAIGMAGYMSLAGMGAIDAFLNASMILSGMGPVGDLSGHDPAKIFAGLYALFSGLLIFGVAGLILAPVLHRILHSFHVADNDAKN